MDCSVSSCYQRLRANNENYHPAVRQQDKIKLNFKYPWKLWQPLIGHLSWV